MPKPQRYCLVLDGEDNVFYLIKEEDAAKFAQGLIDKDEDPETVAREGSRFDDMIVERFDSEDPLVPLTFTDPRDLDGDSLPIDWDHDPGEPRPPKF